MQRNKRSNNSKSSSNSKRSRSSNNVDDEVYEGIENLTVFSEFGINLVDDIKRENLITKLSTLESDYREDNFQEHIDKTYIVEEDIEQYIKILQSSLYSDEEKTSFVRRLSFGINANGQNELQSGYYCSLCYCRLNKNENYLNFTGFTCTGCLKMFIDDVILFNSILIHIYEFYKKVTEFDQKTSKEYTINYVLENFAKMFNTTYLSNCILNFLERYESSHQLMDINEIDMIRNALKDEESSEINSSSSELNTSSSELNSSSSELNSSSSELNSPSSELNSPSAELNEQSNRYYENEQSNRYYENENSDNQDNSINYLIENKFFNFCDASLMSFTDSQIDYLCKNTFKNNEKKVKKYNLYICANYNSLMKERKQMKKHQYEIYDKSDYFNTIIKSIGEANHLYSNILSLLTQRKFIYLLNLFKIMSSYEEYSFNSAKVLYYNIKEICLIDNSVFEEIEKCKQASFNCRNLIQEFYEFLKVNKIQNTQKIDQLVSYLNNFYMDDGKYLTIEQTLEIILNRYISVNITKDSYELEEFNAFQNSTKPSFNKPETSNIHSNTEETEHGCKNISIFL